MPPKMADHRVAARKRMRTSLKMEEAHKQVQPLDSEPEPTEDKPQGEQLDPEAVSVALRQLADQFAKKPAEREATDDKSNVTQLMSRFAANTGQPHKPGPEDSSGQRNDGKADEAKVREAVQRVMRDG